MIRCASFVRPSPRKTGAPGNALWTSNANVLPPFSEPEIAALETFIKSRRFVVGISTHTWSGMVLLRPLMAKRSIAYVVALILGDRRGRRFYALLRSGRRY